MSLFTGIWVSINVVPFGEVWIIFIENIPRPPCETQGKIYANESILGEFSQIKLLKWLLFRLLQPNRHSFITAVFLWRSFFRSFMLSFFSSFHSFLHFFIRQLIHFDKKSFVWDLVLLIKFIFAVPISRRRTYSNTEQSVFNQKLWRTSETLTWE